MKNILFISLLFFFTTCTTYDAALIYHKNFHSGTHPLLRFDGYYSEMKKGESISNNLVTPSVKPVFFYSNGSSFSANNNTQVVDIENQVRTKQLEGAWGNYLINADTITLEKFQLVKSNYDRIILKGIISKDQIHWISRKDHNESYKPVDYSITFSLSKSKPDSTLNFIRTKKKYNSY